ncbi:integrase catalytic domain-containing protein [Trichonephila clavipes]|nr:integrase catalytic domain-containing protein [Trichonephila clavipes]
MMGDLPRDRIVPSRPFEKVGLDYAGPIFTKPNLKRSRLTLKSYIAIFICFSTKATHLEVVSDLTTEAFLTCLLRFIARRSKPSVIWSDNATNFKGARNILNEWNEICKSNRIQLFSAEEGIEWNFIPPASPHFVELWEANMKSMKRILLRVVKSANMNFEELTTLVTQIETVLNLRPLSPLSSDPNDLNPLTHFLTNCAISSFPELYTASDSLSYHSRWKLIQSQRDKFWNR